MILRLLTPIQNMSTSFFLGNGPAKDIDEFGLGDMITAGTRNQDAPFFKPPPRQAIQFFIRTERLGQVFF